MKKIFKIVGLAGIALALFCAVLLFAFYHLIQIGEFRRFLISEVEKRTQLKVRVGEAEIQMGRVVGISFRDFALLGPDNTRPVMTAQRILIRVALLPLLERRIDFYEIRFYQPTLQIARDEAGKISLLDMIVHLPFERQKEAQFTLDLHEIKVEKGEVIFLDHRGERGPTFTYFRDTDLTLRRIQPKDLSRSESQLPVKVATHGKVGSGLEFGFQTAIERDGKRAGLKSKGEIFFPKDTFELRQTWVDADTHVENLPASLFWDYYGHLLPVKAMHGTLGSRLRWQGDLTERIQMKGEIDFKRLEVDAPDIFASVVAPGDGRLELEMELTPHEIRFQRLDLRSKEISLAVQGSMRSLGEEDPYLEVRLTTPFLPVLTAGKFIPLRTLKSPRWEYLVRAVNQGELSLTKAGVAGRLSEIRRLFEPGFEKHIWLDAELREAGGNLAGDRYLPVRAFSGRVVLEKGVLYFKGLKGMYGLSRLAEIEGSQKGVLTGRDLLELRVRGEVDLPQLQEQFKLGLFPAHAAKAAATLQGLSGEGKFGLLLRTDFVSSNHYEGHISLENARLRLGDVSLSQVKGELSFSPREIRAEKITALLAGSPLHIRVALKDYLSDRSTFDLTIDSSGVKAGEALRILLSVGSPQDPGTVRGSLRYYGSLASAEERRLSGTLDLLGVQFPLKIVSQPLRDLHGRVRFDGKGIDLQGVRGQVAGYGFDFSGRWSYLEKPQLIFTFNSPEMDIAHLLPQEESLGNGWYDRLQAKGRISIGKGRYEGFEFFDLRTDLTLDKRLWRLENFSARSLGGTVQGIGSFTDSPEGLRFSIEPKIQGVPVKGFLSWFDIGTTEITGRVNLSGHFDSSGKTGPQRKRNLNGALHLRIEDGAARRFRLLVRVLSFLDLSRWFSLKMPDINQEGVRFRSITGDFKVSRGVYLTQNLFVDSDDLRITGAGEMDGPNGEIDFIIALRPFPGMDAAVNFIPLIGQGLAAIKNSLLVASFRIKGPVDNPTVTPAPLSTLSEFFYGALAIPKGIIGLPGQEKK